MKRLSDEDGDNAGFRNFGRFCFSMIPAALGGAACLWLFAWLGWLNLAKERRMEQRTMESVGLSEMPRTPVKVFNYDASCLKIDSSYIDGDRLQFYARKTCSHWLSSPNYAIRLKARDGTVIDSEKWAFDGDKNIAPGERREQRASPDNDDRTETIDLQMFD